MLIAPEVQNMHRSRCIEVQKYAKDFSLTNHEKKKLTPTYFACHEMKTLSVEFFISPIPLSAGVQSLFSLGIKTFFALRGQAMRIFKRIF